MTVPSYRSLLTAQESVRLPHPVRLISRLLKGGLLLGVLLLLLPWVQTAPGNGTVTAFHPSGQLQNIDALVKGRIKQWHVRDGSLVKAGDPIAEIEDNDPMLIDRLRAERDAALKAYEAAKIAAETAQIDVTRKEELFAEGLVSRREAEQAKIEYKSWLAKEAEAASKLAGAETRLSRQHTQLVTAPTDGLVVRTSAGDSATLVQEGDVLATFVPQDSLLAVELYVNGLDMPLIQAGAQVRLQFEGWPVVQFSGWPSVAIGTFSGRVSVVDPSISPNGRFRIVVTENPGERWPDRQYLRLGARAKGWVLLNTVSVGYEFWRQLNQFPPERTISQPQEKAS